MFFEVGDGDFFVGLDGGSEALFCGLVEVVAAEDFFCVGGAEVDEFLVEVGVVGAEFGDVYLVVGFFGPDDAVFSALDVFGADGLDFGVVLFEEFEAAFFEEVGEVAAAQGGFVGVGGPRVDFGEGGCEEGCGVEGCVCHGCVPLCGVVAAVLVRMIWCAVVRSLMYRVRVVSSVSVTRRAVFVRHAGQRRVPGSFVRPHPVISGRMRVNAVPQAGQQ